VDSRSRRLEWLHFSEAGVRYEPWTRAASELSSVFYCPTCGRAHAQSLNPTAPDRWVSVPEPCSQHFQEPIDIGYIMAYINRGHPMLPNHEVAAFLIRELETLYD
jgi:hypothetical protein